MYDFIKSELDGLYGDEVLQDMAEIIRLYEFYEGAGQDWEISSDIDYKPTKKKTNYVKKLIKEEARFLFGKTPYFKIESESEDEALRIKEYIDEVLKENHFGSKLIKGARDCLIGKRVALKLGIEDGKIKIIFRPALEFVFETKDEDVDTLKKIIFFYQLNNEKSKSDQRIWRQKYELVNGVCILNEGIFDGDGKLVELMAKDTNTGLDFIPAKVIINDGLVGDLKGESDVAEIWESQMAYNKMTSDDLDALRFNMFPQTVATDASDRSMSNIKIAPACLIDLQTELTATGKQARMEKLESQFSYSERFESAIKRVKSDMFDLLNVPNIDPNEMQSSITSAKAIKALYWQLITRCEEKFLEWKPVLEWMAKKIVELSKFSNAEFKISVENVYPLLEDEYEEKANDRAEVLQQVRSRKNYMEKWDEDIDADSELEQIAKERELLDNSFTGMM